MGATYRDLPADDYDVKREQVEFLQSVYPHEHERLGDFLVAYYANVASLCDIAQLLDNLDDAQRLKFDEFAPRRFRASATFRMTRLDSGAWAADRLPKPEAFVQGTDDVREVPRTFAEASQAFGDQPQVRQLLCRVAALVGRESPKASGLSIVVHQLRVVSDRRPGEGAPEGIHQDGMDYIMSALVIERDNVAPTGGVSQIYNPDKTTVYFEHALQPGQGMFQEDRTLWHYVTPSAVADPARQSVRSVLGFDILITDKDPYHVA